MEPSEPQPIEIDYDLLAAALIEHYEDRLRGPRGPPGEAGQVDYQQLANQVVAQLPPIYVDFSGGGSQTVGLGQTLVIPPVRMEIEYPEDGEVTYQEKPLGIPIRLRLVPIDSGSGQPPPDLEDSQ